MKVLFISHVWLPEGTAGVEVYSHTIARALQALGHEVRVICATQWGRGPRYWNGVVADEYEGVPIERLALNWMRAPRPLDYLYRNPVTADYCRSVMREWQPDLVHVMSCYMLSASVIEAARSLGIPIVLHLHDYWFICARHTLLRWDDTLCSKTATPAECQRCMLGSAKLYRWPRRALPEAATLHLINAVGQVDAVTRLPGARGMVGHLDDRRAYLLQMVAECDAIVAPSEYLKRRHEQAGVPEGRIQVVRHGSHIAPVPPLRRASSQALSIGYLGTLSPIKGVHVLIQAFRQLEAGRARLHIHGPLRDDAYVARLHTLTAGDPDVVFHGQFRREEVMAVLQTLDVLVVPSVWYENSPFVIREAYAAGVPVLVSRHGALPELVQDNVDGLHFAPDDVDDLAAQLRRLLDEPGLLPRLRRGIKPLRPLTSEVDDLLAIYHRLATPLNRSALVPLLVS